MANYPLLVLDGAFGTELARRGFDTNDALWSAKALFERPELVEAVHREYYEAGADISTSASYQATIEGFEKKGFSRDQAKELITRSVRLVQRARDAFWRQAAAWISFSCRDDAHTCGGDAIADCAQLLDKEPQVAAIGVNCTAPQHVASLIRQIREHTAKPIVVYPNTGETYDAVTKTWHGSPTPYRDFVRAWYAAGARLIGGCCRTTPDDIHGIAAFRAELQHG